ncbi:hypothetical protein BASA83_012730 [Batrachochytrium salamandrivorans]|nr:hypothetical protein BASA83_012730 [Batrachochytrium salamandrivorans]
MPYARRVDRLALHVGNVPFEDERVSYKSVHDPGETWLTMKKDDAIPSDTCHDSQRHNPNCPVQWHIALCWHAWWSYPAADPLKAALVDQVVLHIDDMNMAIFPVLSSATITKRHFAQRHR